MTQRYPIRHWLKTLGTLSQKVLSRSKKHGKKDSFRLDDYEALARLLSFGYDIQFALNVIATKKNRSRMDELHLALSEGKPINHHLIDIPLLSLHFQFFYQYTSLDQALQQALGMYRYEQQVKKDVIERCTYPVVVMAISIVCFLIMVIFILPMMLDLLTSMDMTLNSTLLVVIRFGAASLIAVIVMLSVIGVWIRWQMSPQRQVAFFQMLSKYWDHHAFKFFHSYLWAGYWLEFQRQGCNTMDALQYLTQMEYRPVTKHCAIAIDEKLKQGISLGDAMKQCGMLSEKLCFQFDVGITCHQLDLFLMRYVEECKTQVEKTMKRLTYLLQASSYLFVGLIVALMSQILFAPMDLLATLA